MTNPIAVMDDGELREQTRRSIARLISIQRGDDTWNDDDYTTAGNILFVCSRLIKARDEQVALDARIDEHALWKPVAEEIVSKDGVYRAVNFLNQRAQELTALKDKENK